MDYYTLSERSCDFPHSFSPILLMAINLPVAALDWFILGYDYKREGKRSDKSVNSVVSAKLWNLQVQKTE